MTKPKPGAVRGRPPITGERLRKVTIYLSPELRSKAQRIGKAEAERLGKDVTDDGNASDGVRLALTRCRIGKPKE